MVPSDVLEPDLPFPLCLLPFSPSPVVLDWFLEGGGSAYGALTSLSTELVNSHAIPKSLGKGLSNNGAGKRGASLLLGAILLIAPSMRQGYSEHWLL
jgi:hypothetical protein